MIFPSKSLAISLSLFISSIYSYPGRSFLSGDLVQAASNLERRQNEPLAITGAPIGNTQPRLEIRELQTRPNMWNIYILALQRMQEQTHEQSYFQISGIHGAPFEAWNGVEGSGETGYCTHSSNLFPTWHRPYLALFEQALQDNAFAVANTFPQGTLRRRYRYAARNLRAPYWDWAASPMDGDSAFPNILGTETVEVITSTGSTVIDNPLFAYKFSATNDLTESVWSQWSTTLRHPTSTTSDAISQNNLARNSIESNRISHRDRVYNLLTKYTSFANFSDSTRAPANQGGVGIYDSIESLHNNIHAIVGGSNFGHMGYLAVSSFDPVFWLHHANIDRLVAMWQVLNPDSWVSPQVQVASTYSFEAGSTQDADSPLQPFHSNSNGDFWTSNTVRSITQFGYTYSDLINEDNLIARINSLYGPDAPAPMKRRRSPQTECSHTIDLMKDPHRDYLVNVNAQKNVLDDSYTIYFFIGPPSADVQSWPLEENMVGSHSVLVNVKDDKMPPVECSGTMPLTSLLEAKVEEGLLESLEENAVTAYLERELEWRVLKGENIEVCQDSVPGLKISLVSVEVDPTSASDRFPTWVGDFKFHLSVTDGKPAGMTGDDVIE